MHETETGGGLKREAELGTRIRCGITQYEYYYKYIDCLLPTSACSAGFIILFLGGPGHLFDA